jgi:hypothetical protein
MAFHINPLASAFVSALLRVDVSSCMNDELRDLSRMAGWVFDGAVSLAGFPEGTLVYEVANLMGAYGLEECEATRLLQQTMHVIDCCDCESDWREYSIGDSDWNPYSRQSVESYSDVWPERSEFLPVVGKLTHHERNMERRHARLASLPVTYIDGIPF